MNADQETETNGISNNVIHLTVHPAAGQADGIKTRATRSAAD
jgi:hypothetical protein